jgi:hypothetical protein
MSEDYRDQFKDKSLAKKVEKKASKNKRRETKMHLEDFKYMNEDEIFDMMDEMED